MSNATTMRKRETNQAGNTNKTREWASQEEAVLAFRDDFEGVCTMPDIGGCSTKIKSVHNDGISIDQSWSNQKNEKIKVPYEGAAITIDSRTFAAVVEINGITLTANGYSREQSKKLYDYLSTLVEMENKKKKHLLSGI